MSSTHIAQIFWRRQTEGFGYEEYNREHGWAFPGGERLRASAAEQFGGDPSHVDPEEAFVAAVAACHMLTFLALCARKRLVVDRYEDQAVGYLKKNPQGKLAITRVELSPRIEFAGQAPEPEELERIHSRSHQECFIANSIHSEVVVHPVPGAGNRA
ncbi:MAG TPA: OsmC family protein [Xanthomonadales bacterium]|nr:OsmC family protein [Xanthomonadales bacterium]